MNSLALNYSHEIYISPLHPFHFQGTFHKPSHFPSPTDIFEDDKFWFSLRIGQEIYGIRISNVNNDGLAITIFSQVELTDEKIKIIITEIRYRFDLDCNLTGFLELAESDSVLNPIVKKWFGMRVSCAFSLYELLCITITLQNAPVNRSVKMLSNLLSNYGKKVSFDNKDLFAFWTPEELICVSEDELKSLKVGYRAKSFLKVSAFLVEDMNFEHNIRESSKQEASKQLRRIYGVGPATCGYLLFEKLHHYDALDHISPWETKILGMLIFRDQETPSSKIIEYTTEKWGQWRMLAVHYLFENAFWQRKTESVEWLDALIRL